MFIKRSKREEVLIWQKTRLAALARWTLMLFLWQLGPDMKINDSRFGYIIIPKNSKSNRLNCFNPKHFNCSLIMVLQYNEIIKCFSQMVCKSTMEISLVWASLAQGVSFVIIMLFITKLAHRKKALMIIIMTFSGISAIGAVLIKDNLTSFIMFFGLLTNELCIGIIYTYFVDMYPTSFRWVVVF